MGGQQIDLFVTQRAQLLSTAAFEKAQIVGVINHATSVGVFVVDAGRVMKNSHT